MSKNGNKQQKSKSVTVVKSNKKANIAVAIVVGIAALFLIAVAVLSFVRVDPMDGFKRPERYEFYNLGSSQQMSTNDSEQSKIRNAMGDMDFSVMNAILQWNWDYSYNFVRNGKGKKIEMNAEAVSEIGASNSAYMVEYVYKPVTIVDGKINYKTAQSLEVDGETVYFDRLKVLIGDTDDGVGEIYLYPYIYERVHNQAADDGEAYASYRVTAIKVRANTTKTYKALANLAKANANG